MSTTSEHWRFVDVSGPAYNEPLTPTVKRALLALVICLHVGGGWALTQVEPVKFVVGDIAPMEVRMVSAEPPAQVSLQTSSGHPELDQSALSAVRAAQFRPYAEGGMAQAVWVLIPINFVLR